MKIRIGFVANSSTTAYCIIGTSHKLEELEEIIKAYEDDLIYGMGITELLGDIIGIGEFGNLELYGLEVAKYLKQQFTLDQCKGIFSSQMIQYYGIHVPIENMSFMYDFCGD